MENSPVSINKDRIVILLHIQPKSSRNMISGIYGDAYKLKITAPPVDGAANKECIKFISKMIKVPKSSISIISGETGRHKKVSIKVPSNQNVNEFKEKIISFFEKKV